MDHFENLEILFSNIHIILWIWILDEFLLSYPATVLRHYLNVCVDFPPLLQISFNSGFQNILMKNQFKIVNIAILLKDMKKLLMEIGLIVTVYRAGQAIWPRLFISVNIKYSHFHFLIFSV